MGRHRNRPIAREFPNIADILPMRMATSFRKLIAAKDAPNLREYRTVGGGSEVARKRGIVSID